MAAEQDRLFLWVPVLFGSGVWIYFALADEPPLWLCLLAAACGVAVAAVWRHGLAAMVIGSGAASLLLGIAAAKVATDVAGAPVLGREMRSALVQGWVDLVEPRAGGGQRITVSVASIAGLAPELTPARVRIRVPSLPPSLSPGDAIEVRASLLPPAGPALPGAYDFARSAWFQFLGAVGSARAPPQRLVLPERPPLRLRLWAPVERLRQQISRRITAAVPGETGAIAAALITGERGGISEPTNQAYRDSGIFHILSISGLHMSIFAGAVYVSCRFLLSLVPALVLRFEIKKWAAVAGLLGTTAYLMISGGSPPAVRSAIMLAIMFVAILLDRPALALRNVALAALVILVVSPPSLVDVGFQMSFAAVVSLISGIDAWQTWQRSRAGRDRPRRNILSAPLGFLGTIVLTTLLATASVAPFAAYHFHKSTQYGVLANLVAVPICNIVVMPAALVTLLAMPLHLEGAPLRLMGHGIEAMSWVAGRVAALPGAVTLVPAIPTAAFASMLVGGLWLSLWGGRWRLAGLVPVALGLALAPWHHAPDVLIGAGGTLVAVRGPDGHLAVLDHGRSNFELARWLEHDADPRSPRDVRAGGIVECDRLGCRAATAGATIAIARHPAALIDDCERADIVLWVNDGAPDCGGARPVSVITREMVSKQGTHLVFVAKPASKPTLADAADAGMSSTRHPRMVPSPQISIETVADWRGRRPWSVPRETAGQYDLHRSAGKR